MVPGEKITPPILDIYSVCENILLRAMRHLLRHRCYGESIISQSFLPSRAGRNTTLRLNRQEARTFVLLMGMVLRLSLPLWFSSPAGFRLSCHGHQDLCRGHPQQGCGHARLRVQLCEQAKRGECYAHKSLASWGRSARM